MLLNEAKTGVGLLVKENKTKKYTFDNELLVRASKVCIALQLPVFRDTMGLVRYCTSLSVEVAQSSFKTRRKTTHKEKNLLKIVFLPNAYMTFIFLLIQLLCFLQ